MTVTIQRIEWIDTLKGFLLILVCLGHIAPKGTLFYDLMCILRPFRMPCFFFLSGLLFSNRRTFTEYFRDKTRSLLLPYIWLSLLFCLLNPRLYDSRLLTQFPDTAVYQYHWLTRLFHPSILQSGLGINALDTIGGGGFYPIFLLNSSELSCLEEVLF